MTLDVDDVRAIAQAVVRELLAIPQELPPAIKGERRAYNPALYKEAILRSAKGENRALTNYSNKYKFSWEE